MLPIPSFVGEFFRNPATVGSLIPSSKELTNKVTEPIDFANASCIVEYGPGTGVFTDILIQRRKAETVVVLVEVNRRFAQLLRERYAGQPNVHVFHGSADQTGQYLQKIGFVGQVDYVLCGLPFSSLPRRLGWRILEHTRQILLPSGKLILFQYSLQNKRLFGKFFHQLDEAHVLLNLPPAYVLVYEPTPEVPTAPARAEQEKLVSSNAGS
ncbi:rRNA adenine N-6-methyltransferase family protein [Hymenobacter sp. YC55]|uniref:class I SAM-dependent methyltransferase n=1 Tax=Hymenobacter sp. YC55 TaxID=3034019 RepID=UPI0023F956BA|nr:rRNA adenine N-6-methyltransferase family protein [Hymenobacter sp. YC55]MDF7812059.1 rRNA adenine N-6-methyltransferase family protein [Hymenobacter sp. YC55]